MLRVLIFLVVNADTVARWNRDRFRRYWARISQRSHPGRPRVDAEIRRLVRTMAQDGWGAPRIHAELTKRGFLVSEMTVSLRLLYGFFVIEHGRRHILRLNATFHPTAAWVIQQLRDAFPYDTALRYSGKRRASQRAMNQKNWKSILVPAMPVLARAVLN